LIKKKLKEYQHGDVLRGIGFKIESEENRQVLSLLKHVVESGDGQQTHPSLWFRDDRNHRASKKATAGSVVAISACKPTAESLQTALNRRHNPDCRSEMSQDLK
jgi:hypothetical protein